MTADRMRDERDQANAIIMRCVVEGLETMGGSAAAMSYIEAMTGMSQQAIPENPENFVWALRHLFRYRSAFVLKNIVQELNAAVSSGEVLAITKAFSDSLTEGIKSIESGII